MFLNLSRHVAIIANDAMKVLEEDKKYRETKTGPYSSEAIQAEKQRDEARWALEKQSAERREQEALQTDAIRRRKGTYAPLIYWTSRCFSRSSTMYLDGNTTHEMVARMLGACDAYRELIAAPLGNSQQPGETYESLKKDYMRFLGGGDVEINVRGRICKAADLTEEEVYELLCQEICSQIGSEHFNSARERGKISVASQSENIQKVLDTCKTDNIQLTIMKMIGLPQ